MTKNNTRQKYLRGWAFWSQNRFWESMPTLSESGKRYYEQWLTDLKQNDKLLQKRNDL